MPYVCAKCRSTRRSFSTPFCMQTTGVAGRRRRGELRQCVVGVLPLDRQQHDRVTVGVAVPRHLCRLLHHGDGQRGGPVGRLEDEARPQGPAVVAPCNQRDVVAPLEQAAPDRATDGTRSHHDEAHGLHSATAACQALGRGVDEPGGARDRTGRLCRRRPAPPRRRPGRTGPG